MDNKTSSFDHDKNIPVSSEQTEQCSLEIVSENIASYPIGDPIKCHRLVGYLDRPRSINWHITNWRGDDLYKSGTYTMDETWIVDLADILQPGWEFRVKVSLPEKEDITDLMFVYTPDSTVTVYFEYINFFQIQPMVGLVGFVPTSSPYVDPYFNCKGISMNNDSGAITKYGLYDLDGKLLYETDSYIGGETWLTSFQEIGLVPGTIFRAKALIIAGEDSTGDVILKYVPDSLYKCNYRLHGTTTKNVLMYQRPDLYDFGNLVTVPTSDIVAYNLAGVIANWTLLWLDGTPLYSSDNQLQYDTWKCDFNALSLEVGSLLRLKSVIKSRDDKVSNEIFEYKPSSSTAYYEYNFDDSLGYLHYDGLVPSANKPPIIKCSSVAAKHSEYPVIMKWSLIHAATGKEIYVSSRCAKGNTWTYSLGNLNIPDGTQLFLKAKVTGGADSTAYIILEYDSTSNHTATFGFYGNSFKTVVPYKGIS